MTPLEQDTTREGQIDQTNQAMPMPEKFETENNKKSEIEPIIDNVVYSQQANNQILDIYYLIL